MQSEPSPPFAQELVRDPSGALGAIYFAPTSGGPRNAVRPRSNSHGIASRPSPTRWRFSPTPPECTSKEITMNLPPVVSREEWDTVLQELRAKEKAATRARDTLAAERRRLPRVRIERDYVFEGPGGTARLIDLFEGHRQLILYHFMFGPNQESGCDGCSMVVDHIGHLAHLHARDTSFAVVSRAPIAKIETYRTRMGWTVPWFSS